MDYKFQKLKVYQLALDYLDEIYSLCKKLPESERYNLTDQIKRAGTSIVLNIAEGSTGRSNQEQKKFLGISIGSFLETVACSNIIERRTYLSKGELEQLRKLGRNLFSKLQAFQKSL